MIKTRDAIATARALLGTPYKDLDCINLIKRVIRSAPGGVKNYTTAGTNALWDSYNASGKYRDLVWRQESTDDALAGMLVFKRRDADVHHVGIVTGEGTVIHSSSVYGRVTETALDDSWNLMAVHRYIEVAELLPSRQGRDTSLGEGGLIADESGDGDMESGRTQSTMLIRDDGTVIELDGSWRVAID